MRARDLAEPFPIVSLGADAMVAARTMASERSPSLIVCDDEGRPYIVLPGSQVLNFVASKYVQEQPGLARTFDERQSDELSATLSGHTFQECTP